MVEALPAAAVVRSCECRGDQAEIVAAQSMQLIGELGALTTQVFQEMRKLQQFTFVCAPTPLQWGVIPSLELSLDAELEGYRRRRDLVVEALSPFTEISNPGGAFYCFFRVPEHLGLTGEEFVEKAVERRVLLVAGGVFSTRDTHVRLSFAVPEPVLEEGLQVLREMLVGAATSNS